MTEPFKSTVMNIKILKNCFSGRSLLTIAILCSVLSTFTSSKAQVVVTAAQVTTKVVNPLVVSNQIIAAMPVVNSAVAINPVVNVNPVVTPVVNPVINVNIDYGDQYEGSWFATIEKDKLKIEFRGDDKDNNWSSSSDFNLSDFPSLPKGQKGDFSLKREAGTVLFTGKFDGDQGYGHYKFTPDLAFNKFLKNEGITNVQNHDSFAFFMIDIKKSFVEGIVKAGCKDISHGNLIAMAALKVNGAYIQSFKDLGYNNIECGQLIAMKSLKITPGFVKGFEAVGYKDIDVHNLIPLKSLNITPEYVSGFKKLGFTDIPLNELPALKSTGVTPEYVASMQEKGFKSTDIRKYMRLKTAFNE
jgi:hypothetical protein